MPFTQSISMPLGTQFPSRSCPPTMHRWSPKLVSISMLNVTVTGGPAEGALSPSTSAPARAPPPPPPPPRLSPWPPPRPSSSPPPRGPSSGPRGACGVREGCALGGLRHGVLLRRERGLEVLRVRARVVVASTPILARRGTGPRGASGDGVGRDARRGATARTRGARARLRCDRGEQRRHRGGGSFGGESRAKTRRRGRRTRARGARD